MSPSVTDIFAARRRIAPYVHLTPLRESAWLTAQAGTRVELKLECVQRTGSFKIRGAFNALARLPRASHVVTASAGNHGRAVAVAAELLGHRATVFAPHDAPATKRAAIERHGAELRSAPTYDDAERAARLFARESRWTYVSPYNHPDVIAGAATTALEILDAAPSLATIVVPVGGGGLIAGVAIALKAIAPRVVVVGVEAAASTAFASSLRAGRIVPIEPGRTLADGLAGNLEPGSITFDIVRRCVDDMVAVTEPEIDAAIHGLASEEHVIAEGAGAAAAAALLAGKVRAAGTTTAIVSGANIDVDRLASILRKQPD